MKRLALFLTLAVAALASGQDELKAWEVWDFKNKPVTAAHLEGLDEWGLGAVRGLVFARHGRVFKDDELQGYLSTLKWYKPSKRFSNSMLNPVERKSLDVIRGEEAKKHEHIQPGDLRFWRTKAFTKEQVGEHSLIDLRIMRSEIEAIHGRSFPDEPQIQAYFEDRYWYKAAKKYDPKKLTAIERKNIKTLEEMEKDKRSLGIQPGDMLGFQNKPITPAMIERLSMHELRLLRNEVYALRGHRFKTKWLADFFSWQEWYKPSRTVTLKSTEQRNVATILKRENQIHDDLSKKPVTEDLLMGLWLEDVQKLRNEIYARRGKIFKSKWLQSYFSSFPWYKPNPKYSDKLLSQIEQKNIAAIKEYEKTAQSQFDAAEG